MIKKLSYEISKRIKSQQYVQSTYIIVKELIENAIDANSKNVKVSIGDTIIVEDDGDGIEDINMVGLEGHTSKEDTSYIVLSCEGNAPFSHGFRGQAIHSIKNMCNLTITSRTKNGLAYKKEFKTNEITKCARNVGTTVEVSDLFINCPLRKSINEKNIKKDLTKICELIESYCCVNKIQFTVFYKKKVFYVGDGYKTPFLYFDNKYPKYRNEYLTADNQLFSLIQLPVVIKDGIQAIFYERRPVVNKKISNFIKQTFNLYQEGNPTYILVLKAKSDINVSVDKTEIIIPEEKEILNLIKSEIERFFSSKIFIEAKTKKIVETSSYNEETDNMDDFTAKNNNLVIKNNGLGLPLFSQKLSKNIEISSQSEEAENMDDFTIKNNGLGLPLFSPRIKRVAKNIGFNMERKEDEEMFFSKSKLTTLAATTDFIDKEEPETTCEIEKNHIENSIRYLEDSNVNSVNYQEQYGSNDIFQDSDELIQNNLSSTLAHSNSEIDYNGETEDQYDEKFKNAFSFFEYDELEQPQLSFAKEDFNKLTVIGQFNKGFIITKLEKNEKTYLIAVDQHAADEIFNFENFKNNFYLKKQKVIVPVDLKLTPKDAMIVHDNFEVFSKNGFIVKDNKLLTVPIYKNELFSIKEFYESIECIKNDEYELKKVREIVASKACRSSVMIGTTLTMAHMSKIVLNLANLKAPWKCPHGRPTFMVLNEATE